MNITMLVIIFVYFTKTSHMERGNVSVTWGTTNISTRIAPNNMLFPSKLYTYYVCGRLCVCIK